MADTVKDGLLFDGYQTIKDKLVERYLTQRQLAAALGMSESKLSLILHGRTRPSKRELIDISLALDINMTEWRRSSAYIAMVFPVLGSTFRSGGGLSV